MGETLGIIPAAGLPIEIARSLSVAQRDGLAFAARELRTIGAHTQTLQVGSSSQGFVIGGGPSRPLTASWGVFGAIGVIGQSTQNQFRTDVQLRLEDPKTNEKVFLSWSIPFAVTLSIASGEPLIFFYAIGGLPTLYVKGDFTLDAWTPFAAKNAATGQIIPVGPLPSLLPSPWTDYALRRTRGKLLLAASIGLAALWAGVDLHNLLTLPDPRPSAFEYELGNFYVLLWFLGFLLAGVFGGVYKGSHMLREFESACTQS